MVGLEYYADLVNEGLESSEKTKYLRRLHQSSPLFLGVYGSDFHESGGFATVERGLSAATIRGVYRPSVTLIQIPPHSCSSAFLPMNLAAEVQLVYIQLLHHPPFDLKKRPSCRPQCLVHPTTRNW